MKLNQKQGLKRKEFELSDDSIRVRDKTTSETREWVVKLDDLGDQTIIEKNSKTGAIIGALTLGAFGLFFIAVNLADKKNTIEPWAWVTIGLFYIFLAGLIFLNPNKREVHLVGGQFSLTFFLDSPSRKEVENFINLIIDKSRNRLIEKYGTVDPDIPEETMMNQLNWLKNKDLLTTERYNELKNDYRLSKLMH